MLEAVILNYATQHQFPYIHVHSRPISKNNTFKTYYIQVQL